MKKIIFIIINIIISVLTVFLLLKEQTLKIDYLIYLSYFVLLLNFLYYLITTFVLKLNVNKIIRLIMSSTILIAALFVLVYYNHYILTKHDNGDTYSRLIFNIILSNILSLNILDIIFMFIEVNNVHSNINMVKKVVSIIIVAVVFTYDIIGMVHSLFLEKYNYQVFGIIGIVVTLLSSLILWGLTYSCKYNGKLLLMIKSILLMDLSYFIITQILGNYKCFLNFHELVMFNCDILKLFFYGFIVFEIFRPRNKIENTE